MMWYLVYVTYEYTGKENYQMFSEETLVNSFVNMGDYWQHIEADGITLQIVREPDENPAVIARELFNIKRN